MKLKIQSKLVLYILFTALLVMLATVFYMNRSTANEVKYSRSRTLRESVGNSALKIQSSIMSDISALRSLAASVSGTNTVDEQQRVIIYRKAMNVFLENNPGFNNVKISWELNYINPGWQKSYGRRIYTFERGDGSIRHTVSEDNLEGDDFSSVYYKVKVNMKEVFTQIANDNSGNAYITPIYKSTLYIPIVDDEDNFCAFVSADIDVENFNLLVKRCSLYESTVSVLLTDMGQVAGTSLNLYENQTEVVKNIYNYSYEIKTQIDSTGFCSYPLTDSLGRSLTICAVGVDNDVFDHHWTYVSAMPTERLNSPQNTQTVTVFFIIIAGLIAVGIVVYVLTSGVVQFLTKTSSILGKLSVGNFNAIPDIEAGRMSELNNIATSLNSLKTGLGRAVTFAEEIGKGNLKASFVPMSETDELGLSLLGMRDSLNAASEEDAKRKDMDSKQNWITVGSAKFGDILRQYNNDMEDFSFNIISNLVKYVGANQGGLFVINDDDKDDVFFELTAGYAYNIRKMLKKKVKPGVGLVGRCILEAESIYINNLPEEYINITSGLGEKSPNCLLIVPFKFNNDIYAVAEIASFTEIDQYKQQFVEEVGHSIASTIATVKINVRTNKLLKELKVQSNELASQEEEMRQNMEAMKASQEAMSQKNEEFEQTIDALGQLVCVVTYTPDGKVIDVNSKAVKWLQQPKNYFVDNGEDLYVTVSETERTETDDFWLQLRLGRMKTVKKEVKINNLHYTITELYNPVQNYYGKIYKVVCAILEINVLSPEVPGII
ncbi:MAG: GAF domain-containing protein [Bacteroidales bacterium]|nr:GAF domain-containing protein [Bacteroidales bacterium]